MPGRLLRIRSVQTVASELQTTCDLVQSDQPGDNIAPGDAVIVYENGGLRSMRWGILPVARKNARGKPVMETIINIRSETVFQKSAFEGTRRCVLIAEGWYEWTGPRGKKTCWQITRKDGGLIYFAAIADKWNGPGGITVDQVAALTCEPNDDLRDIHDRMGVILKRDEIEAWLTSDQRVAQEMMQPLERGVLKIQTVTDINVSSP